MIPILERRDPVEVAAILAEHEKIRLPLTELGVILDLHALREENVEEAVSMPGSPFDRQPDTV